MTTVDPWRRANDELRRFVGQRIDEVPTPVAVVDLDRLDVNIARLATYAREHGIALWPHVKTHKSPAIAGLQLAAGASGLTVAKSGELEIFAGHQDGPLLLHYPVVGEAAWQRAAGVATTHALTVALDGAEVAHGLDRALGRQGVTAEVLIEVDVGLHRTGVQGVAGALALAEEIDRLPSLRLAGISCYPGHARAEPAETTRLLGEMNELLGEIRAALVAGGHHCDRISGGSSPTRYRTHETIVGELRAGTYVFLDRSEAGSEDIGQEACALTVHTSVVSTAVPGQIVVDAGLKSLTGDLCKLPGATGHGAVVDHPALTVRALNEEHGYVQVGAHGERPGIGDRLAIIPNHACTCVNLHDALVGCRNGIVEQVFAVEARGCVR